MGNPRQSITNLCHKLYERGYVVATSGNVSMRSDDGMLITPTSTRKDLVTPERIVACTMDGQPVDKAMNPSSEVTMHAAAYDARPDVGAVIHAHCPHCVACSLMGITLDEIFLPESVVYTGPAPTVPYAMPGSPEQAEAVKPYLANHDAMLLERHGVLVMGHNLEDACSRLEQLEYAARIVYLASARGKVKPLPPKEVDRLITRHSSRRISPDNTDPHRQR